MEIGSYSYIVTARALFLRPLGTFPDGPLETQRSFETLTYAEYYSLFRLVKYTEANDFKPNYYGTALQ